MKAHLYQVKAYKGPLEFSHGQATIQNRLFIPGIGVFGYVSKEEINFFSNDQQAIEEAKKLVDEKAEGYLREVELPDELVEQAADAGERLNQSRANFEDSARSLIERIQE